MTAAHRAPAGAVVIADRRAGRFGRWGIFLLLPFLPVVCLEAATGVEAPLAHQVWIIPVGAVLYALGFWSRRDLLPPPPDGATLTVGPSALRFERPGGPADEVARAEVGLIDVAGTPGRITVTVLGPLSHPRAVWCPTWAAIEAPRVVRVLVAAGYPAAVHTDIYDGRFQAQTPGQPPRLAH